MFYICSTSIVRRARGTRNIPNNNNYQDNSGIDSSNTSNRNNATSNTSSDPSNIWLVTSDHMAVPQVIFTDPQIASVGLIINISKNF